MPTWLPILRRKGCPVLFYSYINAGYQDAYHEELLGISRGTNFHRYVDGWVIIDLEDSDDFKREFDKRLAEPAYPDFFMGQCRRVSDELFDFGATVREQDFKDYALQDLMLTFARFSSLSIRAMPFLTTMVLLQDVVEGGLRESLAAAWDLEPDSDELSTDMQELLLDHSEVPLATESVRDLLAIADKISRQADLRKLIENEQADVGEIETSWPDIWTRIIDHLRRFDFLGTDYYVGDPLDAAQLVAQLRSVLVQQQGAPASEEPDRTVNRPDLAGAEQRTLDIARQLHFLRQHRIEAMFGAGRDARGLLTEIGNRIGLGYNELLALTYNEIQRSLSIGELAVSFEDISARLTDFGIEILEGEARIVTGDPLATMKSELPAGEERSDHLSGVSAFSGTCTAPARVIDRLQDVGAIEAGEILVAPMTSPYHVPAMTIAGAVVTDEGGILSHAAIVSRELGIPCLVGVAGATEHIKTGQRVEVDARPGAGTVTVL